MLSPLAPERSVLFAVLSGFLLALAAPHLVRTLRDAASWVLALLPLSLFAWLASLALPISRGKVVEETLEWVPALGATLSFRLDGLSLLFGLLITGVGALVTVYAGAYLHGDPRLGRFHAALLAFMASMLGLVLAGNVVTLFVAWELTSLTSWLLIGFDHHRPEARRAALQALLVTGLGGLALLAGLVLVAQVAGTSELSGILAAGDALRSHDLYLPALLLVLAGAFTKSAQAPFHFWLPGAMEAPAPVSAYLHSATMVKAGLYLLARLHPALGGTTEWTFLVAGVGGATMLLGAIVAFRQTDLKLLLAWSTVSALGTCTFLIGLGTDAALTAAAAVLLAHALYKGALFLVAGIVDHQTGTRDIRELRGLARAMPVTAAAALVAALSMSGLPPLLGFVSKELVLEAAWTSVAALLCVTIAAALGVAVALMAGVLPFHGSRLVNPPDATEASGWLLAGPATLAAGSILLGLLPGAAAVLVGPAASAARGALLETRLATWHGLTPALGLSLATLAAGALLHVGRAVLREATTPLTSLAQAGPARMFGLALDALVPAAAAVTRVAQPGSLRALVRVALVALVAAAGAAIWFDASWSWRAGDVRAHELVVGACILAGAALAVRTDSRLAAVAGVGLAGYGVALLFLLLGAPDLAMTQFAMESLTVVLLVLVLHRLPRLARLSTPGERTRDALAAGAAGAVLGLLVLLATGATTGSRIAPWLAEHAIEIGRGRNLVNVILVDVRALDTLGEIAVLGVAALGVTALLALRPEAEGARR